MMEETKRKGLGRGLSALLEEDADDYATIDRLRSSKEIPIELLRPNPYQPRQWFDDERLNDLVDSIREKGILQPILVRRAKDSPNAYEIIAGERRWRAAQLAQIHQIPVIIKELTDAEALEVAIIENIQRQDLTAIEEAEGLQRLLAEFGHTQEKLAEVVGKSRSHIANTLRLLQLPQPIRQMLQDGALTAGHARALITARDPIELAKRIVAQGLNVRQTEKLAQEESGEPRPKSKAAGRGAGAEKDADTLALEQEVSTKLGLKVSIQHGGGESGVVQIAYATLEQLDEVCRRLSHQGESII